MHTDNRRREHYIEWTEYRELGCESENRSSEGVQGSINVPSSIQRQELQMWACIIGQLKFVPHSVFLYAFALSGVERGTKGLTLRVFEF